MREENEAKEEKEEAKESGEGEYARSRGTNLKI